MLALKKKSILKNYKKNVDKYVLKDRVQEARPVKSMLLILKESIKDKVLNDIQKNVAFKSIALDIMVYCNYDKKRTYNENEITIKDITISGKIKKNQAVAILQKPYDLVINYNATNDVVLNFLTSHANTTFYVGFAQQQESKLNDIVIKAASDNYNTYHNEIIKYLKILKKLK